MTESNAKQTILVGDSYVSPDEAAQYAEDEAQALGDPRACLNCGAQTVICDDEDCWHHDNVQPRIHVDSESHYCHLDSAGDMAAEV